MTTASGQYATFGYDSSVNIPVPTPDFLRGLRLSYVLLGWALTTRIFLNTLANIICFHGPKVAVTQFIAAIGQSLAARIGYHATRDPMWSLVYIASEVRLLFSCAYYLSEFLYEFLSTAERFSSPA